MNSDDDDFLSREPSSCLFQQVHEQLELGLLHPLELGTYVASMLPILFKTPERTELFITTWCKKNRAGDSYMNMVLSTQDDVRETMEDALLGSYHFRIDWSHPVVLLLLTELSPYVISLMKGKNTGYTLFYVVTTRHALAATKILLDKVDNDALKHTGNVLAVMAVATSVHVPWYNVANTLNFIGSHPNSPIEFFSTQSQRRFGVHCQVAKIGSTTTMLAIENWNLPVALVCMSSCNNKCNFHLLQTFGQSCRAGSVFANAYSKKQDKDPDAGFSIVKRKRQRTNGSTIESLPSRIMMHIVSMLSDNENTRFIEITTQLRNEDGHNLMALVERQLQKLGEPRFEEIAMKNCFPQKESRNMVDFLMNVAAMRNCMHVRDVLNSLYTACLKYKK